MMPVVLVVDDEESVRETLKVMLEKNGYDVVLAENVTEALDCMAKTDPDVVVIDIILPGESGMRLLQNIHDSRSDTPVVVITGEPNIDTAAQSVRYRAFDYLAKPVRKDTILGVVSRAAEFKRLIVLDRLLREKSLRHQRRLEEMVQDRTSELERSEANYRLLVENIPAVVWITDREGNSSFISHNILEVYGFTSEEVIAGGGDLWFKRIHPEDVQRVGKTFQDMFDGGMMFDMEYRIQRKDGRWIWVHDRALRIENVGGRVVAHGLFHDVTDRRNADE